LINIEISSFGELELDYMYMHHIFIYKDF